VSRTLRVGSERVRRASRIVRERMGYVPLLSHGVRQNERNHTRAARGVHLSLLGPPAKPVTEPAFRMWDTPSLPSREAAHSRDSAPAWGAPLRERLAGEDA
jgi:hypothetical protein